MFLSRLRLNVRSQQVRRDLSDCHEMHRTLMSAWPEADTVRPPRQALAVLFRLEAARAGREPTLLVQSLVRPDWHRLPAGYTVEAETKAIDSLYDSFEAGTSLRFRLRANATRSVAESRDRRGRRVELTRREDQLAWLERQAVANGFRIMTGEGGPMVHVERTEKLTGRRTVPGGAKATVSVGATLFEGVLVVTDPQRFRSALVGGLGHAKAYGCGLLSVARDG